MRQLSKAKAEKIVDSMWLIGCHPKPVALPLLLSALLDQEGHYVSEKVIELMAHAGVAPRSGIALLMRTGSWSSANEPPGGIIRSNGKHDALWYPEAFDPGERGDYPWTVLPQNQLQLLRSDPSVTEPIRVACARWGKPSDYEPKLNFPWGASSYDPDPAMNAKIASFRKEFGYDAPLAAAYPVPHHADMFVRGNVRGVVAVAAGRLGNAVQAIVQTRWMFDVRKAARRSKKVA